MFYWEMFMTILILIVLVINMFEITKLIREYKFLSAIIKYWRNR